MTDDAKERLRARGWLQDVNDDRCFRRVLGGGLALEAVDYRDEGGVYVDAFYFDEVVLVDSEFCDYPDLESACVAAEKALEAWLVERLDALRGGK